MKPKEGGWFYKIRDVAFLDILDDDCNTRFLIIQKFTLYALRMIIPVN